MLVIDHDSIEVSETLVDRDMLLMLAVLEKRMQVLGCYSYQTSNMSSFTSLYICFMDISCFNRSHRCYH